jgi:D-3-phosphoglycerate dehydrogenase
MIALLKKMPAIGRAMREQGWAWPQPQFLGLDLAGKTLGLVGVGRIGRSMARMAQGFRMRVLGFDPYVPADAMKRAGIDKADDLHAMLAAADIVSVHAVLNDETRHLIGAREFAAMKPSTFFINVSRGAIADETALLAALQEKRIAGAALDVYGEEPLDRERHPLRALYAMDNVIVFPHLTFYTREAMARLEDEALARCVELLEGKPVLVKSQDPRLRAQTRGVVFAD